MNHPSLLQQEPNLKKALHGLEEHCHQNQKQMESIVTHYSLERKMVGEPADLAGGEPNTSVQSLNEILSKVALEATEEQNRELAESVHHLQQQYEERLQEEIAKVCWCHLRLSVTRILITVNHHFQ